MGPGAPAFPGGGLRRGGYARADTDAGESPCRSEGETGRHDDSDSAGLRSDARSPSLARRAVRVLPHTSRARFAIGAGGTEAPVELADGIQRIDDPGCGRVGGPSPVLAGRHDAA